jgi:hypothetical protein
MSAPSHRRDNGFAVDGRSLLVCTETCSAIHPHCASCHTPNVTAGAGSGGLCVEHSAPALREGYPLVHGLMRPARWSPSACTLGVSGTRRADDGHNAGRQLPTSAPLNCPKGARVQVMPQWKTSPRRGPVTTIKVVRRMCAEHACKRRHHHGSIQVPGGPTCLGGAPGSLCEEITKKG